MGEWWERRENQWLRRHALAAPFGVFIVTAALTYLADPSQWNSRESLQSAAKLVDLGTVLYAMFAVLFDRGVDTVFWALEQRRKRREKWRQEDRVEFLAEMRDEARASGDADFEARLVRAARERGIDLEKRPPR
jgi:hypothetical protein